MAVSNCRGRSWLRVPNFAAFSEGIHYSINAIQFPLKAKRNCGSRATTMQTLPGEQLASLLANRPAGAIKSHLLNPPQRLPALPRVTRAPSPLSSPSCLFPPASESLTHSHAGGRRRCACGGSRLATGRRLPAPRRNRQLVKLHTEETRRQFYSLEPIVLLTSH